MAAAVSAASAAGPSSSLAKDMELVHNSIIGHLELSPAYVSYFVNVECKDKHSGETYRDYCERVYGSPLSDEQWKKWCYFSYEKLQMDKDPNNMDITALGHLFHTLFRAKRDTRDRRQFIKQLKNLKDLRNKVMHSSLAAKDPGALGELEAALQAFIKEAGSFHALPLAEVQDLLLKLKQDVKAGFSPGKKKELYACSCTLQEGWITMELFHQYHFTTQNLLFEIGRVRRSDVFYSPEVLMGGDEEMKPVPFWEIFEQGEKITIVWGGAGSGKSTLFENIALQFINRQPCSPGLLQDFQLMVYVQCRDQSCKSLKDVIQQQFFDVCTKLGVDGVLDAVLKLRTLFLIDGFDEYQQSMTVVQDVIKEVWRADCKVIISTRPRAAKQLRNMLSYSNVCYLEFGMAPLVALEKQLDFLSRYEPHLTRIRSKGELLECFKSIAEPVRSLFSEPIKLLQFCSVFEKMPDRIANWETISDVTEDVFLIYKTLVEKKLSGVRYPNLDIVIDDIFQVICKAAFDFIRSNIFTFTDAQFTTAQRSCLSKIREDHGIKDLDVEVVFTSVMKMTRSFMPREKVIYSFNHKSDQEYFASRHVVHLLELSTNSVREILQRETRTYSSYMEELARIFPGMPVPSTEWDELKHELQLYSEELARLSPEEIQLTSAAWDELQHEVQHEVQHELQHELQISDVDERLLNASPPIWKSLLEHLHSQAPDRPFNRSEGAEMQRVMQSVPDVMPMVMKNFGPTIMQAMVHVNSDKAADQAKPQRYEAADQAKPQRYEAPGLAELHEAADLIKFIRIDLPNMLRSLRNDLMPLMQKIPHMNIDLVELLTQQFSPLKSFVDKLPENLLPMNPYVEVLQNVIRDLSARNHLLLQSYWSEIKEVLEELGANFSTWRDIVLNSPRDTWLVRSATQAAIESNTEWKMMSGRDISAAALMLRHAQPRLLEVHLMPFDTVNPDRWTQVILGRDGDLKLHLYDSRCWDDLLTPLLTSRCRLVYFEGQVATSSSLDALASVACDDAVLHVTVPAPLNFCSLENKCKELWVYSPLQETDVGGESASVLPSLPRPRLIIDHIPSESWVKVVQTITTFAPLGNGYESLHLRDCELTDTELDLVVVVLQQRGIRTGGDGRSRCVKPIGKGIYELIIPDDLHKLTTLRARFGFISRLLSFFGL